MAYSKSYSGDSITLAVITQTIGAKTAHIPGVTAKAELAGLVNAEVASFYYDLAPAVSDGDAGRDFDTSSVGNKKASLTLNKSFMIDEKIPNVAVETIQAGVVADKMLKGSIALANKFGNKFISNLVAKKQSYTYTNGAGAYDALVEAIGSFAKQIAIRVASTAVADYIVPTVAKLPSAAAGAETGKKAIVVATGKHYTASASAWGETDPQPTMYSNAVNGIQPTAVIVGDTFKTALLKDNAFKNLITATGTMPNIVGSIAGIQVVYSQDLDVIANAPEFILLNAEGVAFPYSINQLRVVDSETFNGVRVQGEFAYPATADDIVPISSMVVGFTEAAS